MYIPESHDIKHTFMHSFFFKKKEKKRIYSYLHKLHTDIVKVYLAERGARRLLAAHPNKKLNKSVETSV
jgi:hypothetical protein